MIEKITKGDLLHGMRIETRSRKGGRINADQFCVWFDDINVPFDNLTDDLYYVDYSTDDKYYAEHDEEHDLDIMRVALPSGTVIWERPIVEIRVFSKELHEQNCGTDWTWTEGLDGKLVSFDRIGGGLGHLDGYGIVREWTRELTAEERANWKGARK